MNITSSSSSPNLVLQSLLVPIWVCIKQATSTTLCYYCYRSLALRRSSMPKEGVHSEPWWIIWYSQWRAIAQCCPLSKKPLCHCALRIWTSAGATLGRFASQLVSRGKKWGAVPHTRSSCFTDADGARLQWGKWLGQEVSCGNGKENGIKIAPDENREHRLASQFEEKKNSDRRIEGKRGYDTPLVQCD